MRPTTESDVNANELVEIETSKTIALSFGVKFLNFFTKATALSTSVRISMSEGEPVAIEYPIEELGYIRYYLAPKLDDEE